MCRTRCLKSANLGPTQEAKYKKIDVVSVAAAKNSRKTQDDSSIKRTCFITQASISRHLGVPGIKKKLNVGYPTLPLNENAVWHRRAAILKHRVSPLYVALKPLNSYHNLWRLILINYQKRAVNSLCVTTGELKTSIDPESTVQYS